MGEVYRATDTKLNRDVALKILPEQFASDAQRMGRFQREAEVLASLDHPNIGQIYGIEEAGATKALVLQLIEGPTLAERIAQGAIPVEEALKIALQIAEGLEAAHEKGVIHRDLKPANIKITPEGQVKILDFGLAKALEGETPDSSLSQSPTLTNAATQAGVILGTAAYMSPEQARGKAVDKRADIFAFGAVLYECLTGKRAFEGEDISDTLASILAREPDWEELPQSTHGRIKELLDDCLEKDPHDRPHDISHTRIQINKALKEPTTVIPMGIASAVQPPLWKRAIPWSIAFVIVLWSLIRLTTITPLDQRTTRLTISFPESEPLTLLGSAPLGLTLPAFDLSPDGTELVYVAEEDGETYLYRRPLETFEATRITGTEGAYCPFFSPDGQSVGFFAGGALKKVSFIAGEPVTLAEAPNPRGAFWGPNNSIFVSSREGAFLWEISAAGGEPRQIGTGGTHFFMWPHLLPSGETLLVQDYPDTIRAISVSTGEEKVLLQGATTPKYVSTGHLVYARPGGGLEAVGFDLSRLELSGTPIPILDGVLTGRFAQYAVSRDGTLVYAAGGDESVGRLVWVDRQGTIEPLPFPPAPYNKFEISPDGKQLAIVTPGLTRNVSIFDLESGTNRRLTLEGNNDSPIWTPDGKRVTFASDRSGISDIYWRMADGSGDAEQLTSGLNAWPFSWSPDGKSLIFVSFNPGTGEDIWELSTGGSGETEALMATPSTEGLVSLSPNGRWLAYTSDESGDDQIYVKPYPLTEERHQISTAPGSEEPIWSQSGDELFYRNGLRWMSSVITTDPEFNWEELRELFRGNYVNVLGHSYDVAQDGRFLLLQSERPLTITNLHIVLNWFEELKARVPIDN